MIKRLIFVFLLLGMIIAPLWAGWRREVVATFDYGFGPVAIGDARNDGKLRIYAIVANIGLVELEYLPSRHWAFDIVDSLSSSYEFAIANRWNDQGNRNYGLIIGPGRNDGVNRIYYTTFSKKDSLYEFAYSNGEWIKNVYGIPLGWMSCVIAQARNDDTLRVYCCGGKVENVIYELTWRNGSWDRNEIITQGKSLNGEFPMITAGDGRNDGITRLYFRERFEITYKEGKWVTDSLTSIKKPFTIEPFIIAEGCNDGLNRFYGWAYCFTEPSGSAYYESVYLEGQWVNERILWFPDEFVSRLAIGHGRNDDTVRLYVVKDDSGFVVSKDSLCEYTYTPNKVWSGVGCAKMAEHEVLRDVYIGKGRGDDTNRIYGVVMRDYRYLIVEFSYASTGIEERCDKPQRFMDKLWISPNPSFGSFKVRCSVSKGYATLRIYDISGRLIQNLVDGYKEKGEYSICWDGKDEKGKGVGNGIYFCELRNGMHSVSKKIVYLRHKEAR